MTDYKNVFGVIYNIALNNAHSLFVALDKEHIQSIILNGDTYWTEKSTYSKGLTNNQHKQLAKIMLKEYNAKHLYN